jgi:UDP-MurNAc hydroxylase
MNFKFIGNAGGIFIGSKGSKILCDPWIIDGVFEGSWFHYPPLKTKLSDIKKVDGIYISHVHPDHYDDRFFDFPKDTPLIILNEGPNFLKKNLIKKGFKNFIEIKNNETVKFKEFNLTMYKPFSKHIFEESLLGNLIDSALVLNNEETTAINFNDNTPDEKSCAFLKHKFKKIDLAMLNYNAAGPYPSCFDNLTVEEKKKENKRLLKRNFDHLCKIIPILEPKSVLPFAGSYILGGKNYFKNDYLGTTTWDECADYLKKNIKIKTKIICLRENQIFDILNQEQLEKYERLDLIEMKKYIESIKKHKYEYEKDNEPNLSKLQEDIKLASIKMSESYRKFNINIDSNVFIKVNEENIQIINGKDINKKLYCEMDLKLLRRILDKKAHWNNAEIGAHIQFKRVPNKMDPDVHTLMSFFHL